MSTQNQNKSKNQDQNKKNNGPTSKTNGPKSTVQKDTDDDKRNQTNTNKGR